MFSEEATARWLDTSPMDFWTWLITSQPPPPHVRLLGYDVASVGPGGIALNWTVPAALLNPSGIAHGGFLATILDDAGGLASATGYQRWVPQLTVHLAVDYLAPVVADVCHRVEGTLIRHGRSSSVADAQILDPEGRVCARASGIFQPNRKVIPQDLWDQAGL